VSGVHDVKPQRTGAPQPTSTTVGLKSASAAQKRRAPRRDAGSADLKRSVEESASVEDRAEPPIRAEHLGGRIQTNPYGGGRSVDSARLEPRIQRKPLAEPVRPQISEAPGTIRRLGIWDWIWGGTKTVGEVADTGSATAEAVDETHKVASGLSEGALLTEGAMKTGSDSLGAVGGLIGGTKDVAEGVSTMTEEGVGVRSGLKVAGGTAGLLGAVNKGASVIAGDQADELIKKTIGMGGEAIAGWLDFISGGTKALSGAYLTGTSQLQYNKVKAIQTKSRVAEVKTAAGTLMEIINESWWLGMWDVGLGTMDIAASYSIPGYTAAAKVTSAASKMMGGDLLWGALSWFTGGKVRTNDQVDEEIEVKVANLSSTATALAMSALRSGDSASLKQLYLVAKDVAPEFAEKLSNAVKGLPRKEFHSAKQALKGVVWS
jgi:hypothetical protein